MLTQLEDRLVDFFTLMEDSIDYLPDYSMESVKYVELVLKQLKDRIGDDKDIHKDAAFYIGETIFRNHKSASWEIFEDPNSPYHGMPCIKMDDKIFFPFNSVREFVKNPEIGFFFSDIKEVSQI